MVSEFDYADACARVAEEAVRIVGFPWASRFTHQQKLRMAGDQLIQLVKKELGTPVSPTPNPDETGR